MVKEEKNILLVSGTGRNCGKTTLACSLIKSFSLVHNIYGIKISPYFHKISNSQKLILLGENYGIYEEIDSNSLKDTSRMLKAGATKVYYIYGQDDDLSLLINHLDKIINDDIPVICESGSLGCYCEPGLNIVVKGNSLEPIKESAVNRITKADIVVSWDDVQGNYLSKKIYFADGAWGLHGL